MEKYFIVLPLIIHFLISFVEHRKSIRKLSQPGHVSPEIMSLIINTLQQSKGIAKAAITFLIVWAVFVALGLMEVPNAVMVCSLIVLFHYILMTGVEGHVQFETKKTLGDLNGTPGVLMLYLLYYTSAMEPTPAMKHTFMIIGVVGAFVAWLLNYHSDLKCNHVVFSPGFLSIILPFLVILDFLSVDALPDWAFQLTAGALLCVAFIQQVQTTHILSAKIQLWQEGTSRPEGQYWIESGFARTSTCCLLYPALFILGGLI